MFVNQVAHATGLSPQVVQAWTQAEGGPLGNPLNIGPGRNYGTPQAAAQAVANLINTSGYYGGIRSAVKAGNPAGEIAAIKQSPWDAGHYGNGVLDRTFAGVGGGPVPPGAVAGARQLAQRPAPSQGMSILGSLLDMNNQMQGLDAMPSFGALLAQAHQQAPAFATPQAQGSFKAGSPVADLTSEGGLHPTEGLPGFMAHDYFAPSGSPAVAPVSGKVIRLSGHDPAMGPVEGPHGPLGWSVYIRGLDGRTYYLTHLGSRDVQVGQTLRAGQPIGTVANYAKYGTPSHIHMGVSA